MLAGGITSVAMWTVELARAAMQTPLWQDSVFLVGMLLFVVVPVVVLVVGKGYFAYRALSFLHKDYWLEMRAIAGRGLCWLLGCGAGFVVVALLEHARAV